MIFSINKSFRRVKRFFKDLSGNRWLVFHFVIAIALIAGTSSMLQQEQETVTLIEHPTSMHTAISFPSVEHRQTTEMSDNICIRTVLLTLLGL